MKWKLTQDLCGEPMIDQWDDDEDLTAGFSLLRAIAADPGSGLHEIAPGRFMVSKLSPAILDETAGQGPLDIDEG